jgi:hypothetical protein
MWCQKSGQALKERENLQKALQLTTTYCRQLCIWLIT